MTGKNMDTPNPEQVENDSPNVITFPPVIFFMFYIMGYVTDRAFPTDLASSETLYAIGGALLVFSGAIVIWAVMHFIRAKTPVDVRKPATTLVTDGPYRLSRNPMYIAMTLFYGGFAVAFSLPITLGFLIPCLALLQYAVISREEIYLDRKFGDDYRNYKLRVRRWL